MPVKLQIRDDTGKTTTVPLTRDEVTIGRKEGNTIRLTERNVSRTHARLVRKGEEVHIEDLSRYGTRVNGERISETKRIADVDEIVIGDYTLQLEGSTPMEAAAPAEPGPPAPAPAAAVLPAAPAPPKKAKAPKKASAPASAPPAEATSLTAAMPDDPEPTGAAQGRGRGRKRIESNHPTLVVVTSQLAGSTYQLEGDTLILGRTGENDVQVEHHSISRNHAKIVISDGRVKMVDLQSKNGIRVNGEFWEESVLKSGDIVELGKVQFRFVEAGEDFVYRPEDYVGGAVVGGIVEDDESQKKAGKGWLFLLLLLAAGGLAAFFFLSQQETEVPNIGTTNQVAPATVAPPVTETTQAVAETTAPPTETKAPEAVAAEVIDEALIKTKSAMAVQKWDDAKAQLDKVLALDPEHVEGKALHTRLLHEKSADASYKAALAAQGGGDLATAWTEVQKLDVLPQDSAYKARATELRGAIGSALANKLVEDAQVDIASKRYDEAIAKGNTALEIQPNHPDAKGMMDTAAKLKAVGQRRPPTPDRKPPVRTIRKPPVETPAPTAKSGKDLYREAFDIHNTNPDGALALYEKAAAKRYAKAYKQMGSIYMKKGNTTAAKKAYSDYLRLNPGARDAETVKDIISRL